MALRNTLQSHLPSLFFAVAFLVSTVFLLTVSVVAAPLVQEESVTTPPTEGAAEQQFFDKVDVDLINIDVVVTDKKGQPVTGLPREDFEILVDGEEVEVVNLFEVGSSAASTPDIELIESEPSEAKLADSIQQTLSRVIFVDNRNIRPENRRLLFERLQEYLAASSTPNSQTMLVTMGRKLEIVVPFTSDSNQITNALEPLQKKATLHTLLDSERRMFMSRLGTAILTGYNPQGSGGGFGQRPGSDAQSGQGDSVQGDPDFDDAIRRALNLATDVRRLAENRYRGARTTTTALGQFCETLGGMPGRKALIYLSDGIPMRPADTLIEAWTGKYQTWALTNSDDIRTNSSYPDADRTFQQVMNALASSEFDLSQEIRQMTARASANRVAFYPISNGGRSSGFVSAAVSGGTIGIDSGSSARNTQITDNFSRDATLLTMAEDTGGQALIRNANIGELLDRAAQDFQSFYSLGYHRNAAGEKAGRKAKASKIRVKVKQKDLVVRHGKSYQPKTWRDRLGAMTLASALFEVEDNSLGAVLEPGEQVPEGKRFRVPIMIRIPFDQIRLVYRDDSFRAQLTALVVVRDEDDGVSETQRIDFPIKIPGRRIMEAAQHEAGYLLELEMAKGPKRVTVGIRDHLANTESTLHLDLEVGNAG